MTTIKVKGHNFNPTVTPKCKWCGTRNEVYYVEVNSCADIEYHFVSCNPCHKTHGVHTPWVADVLTDKEGKVIYVHPDDDAITL